MATNVLNANGLTRATAQKQSTQNNEELPEGYEIDKSQLQPTTTTTTGAVGPEGNSDADILRMQDSAGVTESNRQAQEIAENPEEFLSDTQLADRVPTMEATPGTTMDPTAGQYQMSANGLNVTAETAGDASVAAQAGSQQAQTYDTKSSTDRIAQIGEADAATGQVRDDAVIDPSTVDVQGTATGRNEDGSRNYLGESLNQSASQSVSNVIDTSTVSGKLLAQELGEGNYTDERATLQGQMGLLSKQFEDSEGNPKIPTWAAGTAREVSRIAAFKGITGTAATGAMSQAIMEASLPIAEQDAKFFQSLTQQNLDNRQQMTVNKANVLSKMELANLDSRMNAAVNNSKNFMQMDLANLDNEQQAEVINTQSRVQSILEESKAENSARLFGAESQNDFAKFYDQLNTQIDQFNSTQQNNMSQFNAGEINSTRQFNSQLENQRETFYKEMQFNVDMANAQWRQEIETTNNQREFQAAATDVQNMFNLSTESLNRVWDRADAAMDYAWKSSESDLDRQNRLAIAEMQQEEDDGLMGAVGSVAGSVLGNFAGSQAGSAAIAGIFSDIRLKTNITKVGSLANGLGLYEWDWNDEGLRVGAGSHPTTGVLAQEALEIVPDAVSVGTHGYYMIDYSKVN